MQYYLSRWFKKSRQITGDMDITGPVRLPVRDNVRLLPFLSEIPQQAKPPVGRNRELPPLGLTRPLGPKNLDQVTGHKKQPCLI